MGATSRNQEKLDPRVKRTRQALEQAFAALVAEKGFATLSVRELAKRAGVNRATFYAHFVDKYALLEYAMRTSFQRELEQGTLGERALTLVNLRAGGHRVPVCPGGADAVHRG